MGRALEEGEVLLGEGRLLGGTPGAARGLQKLCVEASGWR